jgi:hypothetical protein
MEDLGYAYFHYDLLDMATLTTIILKVKLLHIKMYEEHLQKHVYEGEFIGFESKFKKGFE